MGPQSKSTPARGMRAQTPGATESIISLNFSAPASSADFAEKWRTTGLRRGEKDSDGDSETNNSARRQLARSLAVLYVRPGKDSSLMHNSHYYRPSSWGCIRHAASCYLPLSKRRAQLK
jgi:hypothetical protein